MPPSAVKSVRELIYWEYAKLVAEIAVGDRKNFRYVMATFQRFKHANSHPLAIMRENGLESKGQGECAYCGSPNELTNEYIIPLHKGGPDRPDNQIMECHKCKKAKGEKDLFKWYGKKRQYEIPRLVCAKYLKLVYDIHEGNGTLDSPDINKDGRLNVFDLGSLLRK